MHLADDISGHNRPAVQRTAQEIVGLSAVSKASSFPLSRSQTRSVLSRDAETAWRPSGVMATAVTDRCGLRAYERFGRSSRSQTSSGVLSKDAAKTARRPSGVMKFWMNSYASWIGSPTGTPRRMRPLVFMVVVALKIAVERADTLRTGNGVCSFCRKDTAAEGSLPLLKSCLYDPSRSRNNGTSWLSGAGCLRPADALALWSWLQYSSPFRGDRRRN